MQVRNLIHCPRCEATGKLNILGEIIADGSIKIVRAGGHLGQFTRVAGNDLKVFCNIHDEPVFERRADESVNIGTFWVRSTTFIGTLS